MTFRSLLTLFLVSCVALAAAFLGCGGAACFRNSDCHNGYGCRSGACELLIVPDAGDAGDASDTSDAASSDGSTDLGAAGATQ